jgi:hypothetical protein
LKAFKIKDKLIMLNKKQFLYTVLLILLVYNVLWSQEETRDSLFTSFDSYVMIPQEIIHLHLNKSILMQEEDLGFTAYVLNKRTKKPSVDSKNLYIQLLDSDEKVVKEQLILLKDGAATSVITLDSTFLKGDYVIRAFTSWMKNFENAHFFESKFKVLEPYTDINQILESTTDLGYDIQMMPESGRAVDGVFTQVGLLVKNQLNKGVKTTADVLKDGVVISQVETNEMGLGKFTWLPDLSSQYRIQFSINGVSIEKKLPEIAPRGITLSVKEVQDKIYVEVKSNKSTVDQLGNNNYFLVIQGSSEMKGFEFKLDSTKTTLPIGLKDMSAGVNQVILFDADNRIVCERLFYKHDESKMVKTDRVNAKIELDSVKVDLKLDNAIWKKEGVVSLSMLPSKSIAGITNENIVTTFELKPYINGFIENPAYYFTDVDRKVKYDLDNLMICQGWKIYDWTDIFSPMTEFKYPFEVGIIAEVQLKNNRFDEFMVYAGRFSSSRIIDEKNEDTFYLIDYYPSTEEKLRISGIGSFGKAKKIKGRPSFYPSKFPSFRPKKNWNRDLNMFSKEDLDFLVIPFVDNSESLDTVVLTADNEKLRQKEIKRRAKGKLYFFDDQDRIRITSIEQYLNRTMGVSAVQRQGEMTVVFTNRGGNAGLPDPVLELDGVVYYDFNILMGLNPSWVDYIEIGFSGVGGPPGSQGGFIRIKTDPLLSPNSSSRKDFSEFEIPLVFEMPVNFYAPQYFDYYGDFFNKLGVIDWKGNVQVNKNGEASVTVPYLGQDSMIINVQGWNEHGQLVSDVVNVEIKP